MAGLHWDLFCRVIDNHGDAGVCRRLARRLVALGDRVRLWIDDPAPLAFMAPGGDRGVEIRAWGSHGPEDRPGDVVVEAFGCELPSDFIGRMAAARRAPVWINLEYLSAEATSERNHALPSPQAGGLTKWFFYPGFTPRTGGLLREQDLDARRARFDRAAWLAARGLSLRTSERVVSLFGYTQPRLTAWWAWLAAAPTLVLAPPCDAREQALALPRLPGLRVHALPWMSQDDFDDMLWAADLNLVRGEDSLVRALWAGQPLLWQIYPQHDGAHGPKLDAFLANYLQDAPPALARALGSWARHWAGTGTLLTAPPDPKLWADWCAQARRTALRLAQGPELGAALRDFVLARRAGTAGAAIVE